MLLADGLLNVAKDGWAVMLKHTKGEQITFLCCKEDGWMDGWSFCGTEWKKGLTIDDPPSLCVDFRTGRPGMSGQAKISSFYLCTKASEDNQFGWKIYSVDTKHPDMTGLPLQRSRKYLCSFWRELIIKEKKRALASDLTLQEQGAQSYIKHSKHCAFRSHLFFLKPTHCFYCLWDSNSESKY